MGTGFSRMGRMGRMGDLKQFHPLLALGEKSHIKLLVQKSAHNCALVVIWTISIEMLCFFVFSIIFPLVFAWSGAVIFAW